MADERDLAPIGRDGQPIRALAFAGGGFNTIVQMGVVHALLVSRGRPPDLVIGASAGAVNAVSLAEVMQAGAALDGDARLQARIGRFREIYEAALNAPGDLLQAYAPDTFQIDTQRPLEPVQLPIHRPEERRARESAVAARAGLINLYNALLGLRLSIGTVTLLLRRLLGLRLIGSLRPAWARLLARGIELFRTWTLFGENLWGVAPLIPVLGDAVLGRRRGHETGATAGQLIFRSRVWSALARTLTSIASFTVLAIGWVVASLALLAGIALPGWIVLTILGVVTWPPDLAGALRGLAIGLIVAVLLGWLAPRPRGPRALGAALWAVLELPLLVLGWSAALAVIVAGVLVLGFLISALFGAAAADRWWRNPDLVVGAFLALGVAASLALVLGLAVRRAGLARRLLARFGLHRALFDAHPVRALLIGLFDREYYGDVNLDAAVATARASRAAPAPDATPRRRRFADYAVRASQPPIHVAVTVADVASGEFRVLPASEPVVDGLLAALAMTPILPAAVRGDRVLVDGTVVAREPTRPLFAFLRREAPVNERASALHVFSVAALPFSAATLGAEREADGHPREYTDLVDIVLRALELQQFRDATLERRLTELQTRAMPPGRGVFFTLPEQDPRDPTRQKRLLRTWIFPIEPDEPLRLNRRVLEEGSAGARRRVVAEAAADGCRAALERMAADAVREAAAGQPHVSCWKAMQRHLQVDDPRLPTRDHEPLAPEDAEPLGPGLFEVCRHCTLNRARDGSPGPAGPPRTLRVPAHDAKAPSPGPWPRDGQEQPWTEPESWRHRSEPLTDIARQDWPGRHGWPRSHDGMSGTARPTVSFLFSGGVFRGVFQLGVLNGLSEARLRPDVVAGASVGSITAAMVARTFLAPGPDGGTRMLARQRHIRRLAGAYLTLDRLVLTDRFADFIRAITVRSAQTRFSLRDADRVFRRYDQAGWRRFDRELRTVIAGLERLTYISPFELKELVDAIRRQQSGRVFTFLRAYFQEWLDRAGVGTEVLGAEPLERLITDYVLEGMSTSGPPAATPFRAFVDGKIFFLATATNLTDGGLEILGEEQLEDPDSGVTLLHGLLASSAFPGVFRPRWLSEFRCDTRRRLQYIDGGVIDNLPVDAVAQFLHRAARGGVVASRPAAAPHLVFCASLEPALDRTVNVTELRDDWPALRRRAGQLAYNEKLEVFSRTQRNVRAIVDARTDRPLTADDWTPLDLEVVSVIPRWLCGTFAFHPMLGFRRERQAASIAHGCAATLVTLARAAPDVERARAWGIDRERLPHVSDGGRAASFPEPHPPARPGNCWFRPAIPCPFSREAQATNGPPADAAVGAMIADIYERCGRAATHRVDHG